MTTLRHHQPPPGRADGQAHKQRTADRPERRHDVVASVAAQRRRGRARRSDLEFRRLLERLPAAAYTCDAEGLITYYNALAVRLWGREPKLNDPVDRYCGSFKLFLPDGTPIKHDECWMARALIEERGFNGEEILIEAQFRSVVEEVPHWRPAGTVVSQSPPGGTRTALGSAVELEVSDGTGDRPRIPDVIGLPLAEARELLLEMDLEITVDEAPVEDRSLRGRVLGQDPVPGAEVEPGDVVLLVGGRAPT
jgi:hypothetical protein